MHDTTSEPRKARLFASSLGATEHSLLSSGMQPIRAALPQDRLRHLSALCSLPAFKWGTGDGARGRVQSEEYPYRPTLLLQIIGSDGVVGAPKRLLHASHFSARLQWTLGAGLPRPDCGSTRPRSQMARIISADERGSHGIGFASSTIRLTDQQATTRVKPSRI